MAAFVQKLLIFLLFCVAVGFASSSDDAFSEDVSMKIEEGRTQYNFLKQLSKKSKYGSCWQKAKEDLESGCKRLTDDVTTRLALSFADCHLTKDGKQIHPCNTEEDVTECLKNAGDPAASITLRFLAFSHSICFFLKSQTWHDETKKTLVGFVDASSKVCENLETNCKLQAVFNAFKSTNGQNKAVFEVLERILKLQSMVLGEFTGLSTLNFFLSAACLAYLLTSTRRTSEARFGMFVALALNFVAERVLINLVMKSEQVVSPETIIHERIWIFREVTCLVCAGTFAFVAYHYQDYGTLNNKLLKEVHTEMLNQRRGFPQGARWIVPPFSDELNHRRVE